MYRLNLYRGSELIKMEIVDAPLDEAKDIATSALTRGQHHRAELVNGVGSIVFQRWAVL